MRVLVLGGSGFIGSYVVKELVEKGHEIIVVHRGRSQVDTSDRVSSLVFSRDNILDFTGQIKKAAPDVVVDMIPKTAQDFWSLQNVVNGLARRIVVISSIDVYRAYNRLRRAEPGPPDPFPLKENSPLRQKLYPYRGNAVDALHTAYEYEKILVERLAQTEPDLPCTILRLPVVYGPGDPQYRLFDYLKRMDDRRPAIILGKLQAQWCLTRGYVQDVARAVAIAAEDGRPGNQIYNVGEREALSELQWLSLLAEAADWHGEIVQVEDTALPEHLCQGYDWRQHLTIDSGRFQNELKWQESIDRKIGLEETIAWQRKNPPADIDADKFNYKAEDQVLRSQARPALQSS